MARVWPIGGSRWNEFQHTITVDLVHILRRYAKNATLLNHFGVFADSKFDNLQVLDRDLEMSKMSHSLLTVRTIRSHIPEAAPLQCTPT